MTWVLSENDASCSTTDGKYQVRPGFDDHALFTRGLERPLMVGSRADCRACAEALESDEPLERIPPLKLRPQELSRLEREVVMLTRQVARSGARLIMLRGAAAPTEMVQLEMNLLRRLSRKLVLKTGELQ